MKEEDVDWLVYHLIPPGSPMEIDELAGKSGLDRAAVGESLARLERSCLVQRHGTSVKMLNFGEALIRNQAKYEKDLPYTIENGVIIAKRKTP